MSQNLCIMYAISKNAEKKRMLLPLYKSRLSTIRECASLYLSSFENYIFKMFFSWHNAVKSIKASMRKTTQFTDPTFYGVALTQVASSYVIDLKYYLFTALKLAP